MYEFPAACRDEIFINENSGITILQKTGDHYDPEQMIAIGSKKRAIEIARAIRALAMVATFEPFEEDLDDD